MEYFKVNSINQIVDASIKNFAEGLDIRYKNEIDNPNGVINSKRNNIFISELGDEFMFYSAFVRSFDSSFGKVLENMSNNIAQLNYEVMSSNGISSYILPQQQQQIDFMMSSYEDKEKPKISDYTDFKWINKRDTRSFETKHATDNLFYDKDTNTYYILELKAGGDLDNKKAKSEKIALLNEYFLLKNYLNDTNSYANVKIFLATAYNKDGEGNEFKNDRVRQFFCKEELLIGSEYWNFVCKDEHGFEVVIDQYRKSCNYIKKMLNNVKEMYFGENHVF
jgi:hypothetical protein